MMTKKLPEPHTLQGDGSSATAAYAISSDDEEVRSSSYTDSDDLLSPDPAGTPVGIKVEDLTRRGTKTDRQIAEELQAFEDGGEVAIAEAKTTSQTATAGASADDGLSVSGTPPEDRPRDAAGRFVATPRKTAQDQESHEEKATRERQEAFEAGKQVMLLEATERRTRERHARKERRAKRKEKRKQKHHGSSFEKKVIRRTKAVRALSYNFVALDVYTRLKRGVRVALWDRNNNVIWSKLTAALGDRYSYLLAQMQEQDGVKAWQIVNRSHSESSAASESHYLQEFLQLKLENSATGGEKPTMSSYIEKLSEIAELYSQSRADNGQIEERLWRMKVLDLPPWYSDAVTALEIADAEARKRGEDERTSQEIAAYVTDFEVRRRRKREQRIADKSNRGGGGRQSDGPRRNRDRRRKRRGG